MVCRTPFTREGVSERLVHACKPAKQHNPRRLPSVRDCAPRRARVCARAFGGDVRFESRLTRARAHARTHGQSGLCGATDYARGARHTMTSQRPPQKETARAACLRVCMRRSQSVEVEALLCYYIIQRERTAVVVLLLLLLLCVRTYVRTGQHGPITDLIGHQQECRHSRRGGGAGPPCCQNGCGTTDTGTPSSQS